MSSTYALNRPPSPGAHSQSSTFISSTATAVGSTNGSIGWRSWTKPKTYRYSLSAFSNFPKRLFSPPEPGVPLLATVGSFSLKPAYEIRLEDILAGKHQPPLGLKDFEEWLMFRELSVENLYFLQWLQEYTNHYNSGNASSSQLWFTFLRAKASFFVPNGSLELNLPSHIVKEIAAISLANSTTSSGSATTPPPSPTSASANAAAITVTSPTKVTSAAMFGSTPNTRVGSQAPPPPPSAFHASKKAVEAMLSVSLSKFVQQSMGNADAPRSVYCTGLALGTIAMGLIPTILGFVMIGGRVLLRSRWWRLLGLPFFWQGIVVMLCSYARICMIIYFWGDYRQLHGYELDMPSIAPGPLISKTTTTTVTNSKDGSTDPTSPRSKLTYPPPTSQPTIQEEDFGCQGVHEEDDTKEGYKVDVEAQMDTLSPPVSSSPTRHVLNFASQPSMQSINSAYMEGLEDGIVELKGEDEEESDDLKSNIMARKGPPAPSPFLPLSNHSIHIPAFRTHHHHHQPQIIALSPTSVAMNAAFFDFDSLVPTSPNSTGQPVVERSSRTSSSSFSFFSRRKKASHRPTSSLGFSFNANSPQVHALGSKKRLSSIRTTKRRSFVTRQVVQVFAPVTKIVSPIVQRAIWTCVMRSSAWACVFAVLFAIALIVIPEKR
ncbi:uncharacterized protein EI90DRAFT_3288736 [Cantharellus anzutake]|uniref:uncharacterized protein n=1 Tax=Cantharellus anzutake TaxID=1750568 RepID=UPI001908646B|nr:uncharacterized protein EI90DRAFT_3288736 [Cantharellus anzutake]KAF8333122.1 hypothetical protein EI90DRAFT_3288736 [Cantharellus anzutake]